jgi:hypothetical protein
MFGSEHIEKVLSYSPTDFWPMNEASGTTAVNLVNAARNGTYGRDVSTMTTGPGIGDGGTAPLFNGTDDYLDVTAANATFNGGEGSFSVWVRADATTDNDAVLRRILRVVVDGSNWVIVAGGWFILSRR